ncbi:MAG: DNA translocase FtsK [Chloroflexota bacterium]|nr:DNA translocase FtsK [Chloroflexota bacterium]
MSKERSQPKRQRPWWQRLILLPVGGPRRLILLSALVLGLLIWKGDAAKALYGNLTQATWLAFGWGLVPLGAWVAVVALSLWNRPSTFYRRWNRWLGSLVLLLFSLGLLAFFKPASGPLNAVSLGGSGGTAIIGGANLLGVLRLLGLLIGAWVLFAPRQAYRVALRSATGLMSLYRKYPLHRYARDLLLRLKAWGQGLYQRLPKDVLSRPAAWGAEVKRLRPPSRGPKPSTAKKASPPSPPPEPASQVAPTPLKATGEGLPPVGLLDKQAEITFSEADNWKRAKIIEEALASYGVEVKVVQVNPGPAVTQFAVEPGWDHRYRRTMERDEEGKIKLNQDGTPKTHQEEVSKTRVKVERIKALADDLALALAAPSIRIEAPVPGKPVVGVEVPNTSTGMVALRGVIESAPFQKLKARSKLALALGKGAAGEVVVTDLARMPHLLIAGATGSGKTVCLYSCISCLLMHNSPKDLRLLMIDPKRVELTAFNNVPHLLAPVVVEVPQAINALRRVVQEMDQRFTRFSISSSRNIDAYNRSPRTTEPMPYLVVIIDELADLMMTSAEVVEPMLCRLAQMSRATGIHLVVATQRPSVDVITGLIKANFPARISFAVTSQVDSRTILDNVGAEKLLGQGDMLFMPSDAPKPKRLQGTFASDQEVEKIVNFWVLHGHADKAGSGDTLSRVFSSLEADETTEEDPLLEKARELAKEYSRISASLLMRKLHIGYPRAAQLVEMLQEDPPEEGEAEDEAEMPPGKGSPQGVGP